MTPEYYLYSCHFPSTKIFGCLFSKYVASEYIRIYSFGKFEASKYAWIFVHVQVQCSQFQQIVLKVRGVQYSTFQSIWLLLTHQGRANIQLFVFVCCPLSASNLSGWERGGIGCNARLDRKGFSPPGSSIGHTFHFTFTW